MTNIRELLDEATRDVVSDPTDATTRVRRGVRARRQSAGAVIAVVAAVAAATAVPISLSGGGAAPAPVNKQPPPAKAAPILARWTTNADAVTSGFGKIWALHSCSSSRCKPWVDELDPASGTQLAHIYLASPALEVAAGAGYVWAIGSDSGSKVSRVTAIDPTTQQVTSRLITGPQGSPYDIAFAAGSAWITIPGRSEVLRFIPGTGVGIGPPPGFQPARIHVSGEPETIASTGGGQVWVQSQGSNTLTQIVPTDVGGRVGTTVTWSGPLLGTAGKRTLLTVIGTGNVASLEPRLLSGCDACAQSLLTADGSRVVAALMTSRGLFVATSLRTYFHSRYNLSHFGNGFPNASASVTGTSLAADHNGVVVADPTNGIFRFTPPAAGHTDGHPVG